MSTDRNRAWRRFKKYVNTDQSVTSYQSKYKGSEKNWKMMYGRSEKIIRARQLGFEYPKQTTRQLLDDESPLSEPSD